MAGLQKLIGNQSKKNYFTYILKKKKKHWNCIWTFYVICLAIKTINISYKFSSGGGGDSGNNEGGVWWWCGRGNKVNNDDNGGDGGGSNSDGVSGIKERREWEYKGMMKNTFYLLSVRLWSVYFAKIIKLFIENTLAETV